MRPFLILALLLPTSALADQIVANSHITAVTIYPQGAQVTREVDFDAPAGQNELLITDLPADTQAELIRMQADGVVLGAFSLRTDRLPPHDTSKDPKVMAAKAALEAARVDVRAAQGLVDAINAKIDAATAQADFLRGLRPEGAAVTVDGVKAMAEMVGAEVLLARQAALAAGTGLPAAELALEEAQLVLANLQANQDAMSQGAVDYSGLSVAVDTATAGKAHLVVTHYVSNATWAPVYDMNLIRKPEPSLTIVRGVLVSQDSGEDWAGVDLTLSTAQPSAQAEPSPLWPELRRVVDPAEEAAAGGLNLSGAARMGIVADAAPEPAMEAAPVVAAAAAMQGDVVVYHYPTKVDVAGGVENLRLALDEIKVTPTVVAQAVPRMDQTAFVMARFTNDSPEILLPGQAFLMREGSLVGGTMLSAVAPGDKAELGFGAIDGLRLTRDMPLRAEGDRGILTTSTQVEEKAVLKLENLTDEAWPVRLLDLVPYSEQEELTVTFAADPAPTEVDVKGQRGVLAWEFDLGAGETKEVSLDSVISWPEGKELQ